MGNRFAGRFARVYLGIANTAAAAQPLDFIASYTLNGTTEKFDATAFGDVNKVSLAGLPDASGTFEGFADDASAVLYTIAQDGQPRKFYLYPTLNTPTSYFFGTILPDFSTSAGVGGVTAISSNWSAASAIIRKD